MVHRNRTAALSARFRFEAAKGAKVEVGRLQSDVTQMKPTNLYIMLYVCFNDVFMLSKNELNSELPEKVILLCHK